MGQVRLAAAASLEVLSESKAKRGTPVTALFYVRNTPTKICEGNKVAFQRQINRGAKIAILTGPPFKLHRRKGVTSIATQPGRPVSPSSAPQKAWKGGGGSGSPHKGGGCVCVCVCSPTSRTLKRRPPSGLILMLFFPGAGCYPGNHD